MHELAFADVARPAGSTSRGGPAWSPQTILLLPMRPFSVGHELLLLQQRNPLLFGEEVFNGLSGEEQRTAIIRAALICYRTWTQNQKRDRLGLWGWLIRRSNWALEIAEWRNYRAAGSAGPPSPTQENYEIANGLQKEEGGREFGGCHFARLLTFLGRDRLYAALGAETPYDMPLGLANHLYLSDLELDGNYRIENRRERQVAEEMDEHRAAAKREREAEKANNGTTGTSSLPVGGE